MIILIQNLLVFDNENLILVLKFLHRNSTREFGGSSGLIQRTKMDDAFEILRTLLQCTKI